MQRDNSFWWKKAGDAESLAAQMLIACHQARGACAMEHAEDLVSTHVSDKL